LRVGVLREGRESREEKVKDVVRMERLLVGLGGRRKEERESQRTRSLVVEAKKRREELHSQESTRK